MGNNYFFRALLISFLLLLGYTARCQNAVFQAHHLDSLYKRIESLRALPNATHPAATGERAAKHGDEPLADNNPEIVRTCRHFFEILAANDVPPLATAASSPPTVVLPTLAVLRGRYEKNPFLEAEVAIVAQWWAGAQKALDIKSDREIRHLKDLATSITQGSSARLDSAFQTRRIQLLRDTTRISYQLRLAKLLGKGHVPRRESKKLFQKYQVEIKAADTIKVASWLLSNSRLSADSAEFKSELKKVLADYTSDSVKVDEEFKSIVDLLYKKYTMPPPPAAGLPLRGLLSHFEAEVTELLGPTELDVLNNLQKFSQDTLAQVPGPLYPGVAQVKQFVGDSAWQAFMAAKKKANTASQQAKKTKENEKVNSSVDKPINYADLIAIAPPTDFSVAVISLPSPSPLLAESGRQPRTSTGSLQGDIINGTADFIAGRFKEEMNAAFFQHFATMLHDTAYAELGILFPSTARLLTSGTATYGTLVQTLRGSFEHDLRELLFNYGELVRSQRFYERQLADKPHVVQGLRYSYLATRTLYYLGHGTHPADLLTYLNNDIREAFASSANPQTPKPEVQPLLATLSIVQVLSGALLDDAPLSRAWVTTKDLGPKLNNPRTRRFFAGLVWQRLSRQEQVQQVAEQVATAALGTGIYQRVLDVANKGAHFQAMLLGFVNLTTQLQDQTQRLQKRTTADTMGASSLRAADFVPLYQLVQQGMTFVTQYTQPPAEAGQQSSAADNKLFSQLSTALIQGYVAADRGDYGVTISNFLEVVLLTLNSPGHAEATATATTYASSLTSTQAAQTTLLSLPQIVRYGTFMAALAQAKSAEDVHNALEAAALPVGSSSVKRRSFSTLSVNAFAGGGGGLERTFKPAGSDAPVNTPWRAAIGFSAPVGLAFSWGWYRSAQPQRVRWMAHPSAVRAKRLRRLDQAYRYYGPSGDEQYLTGSSFSLFASVIDLGVPVLLRLSDSQTGAVPRNIDFRHVFAPGIYAVHGFRNTPVSAFAGVQFTPQLRQLADTAGLAGAPAPFLNSLRINAGLTIDIPIFTLFNRSESRQPTPGRLVIEREQHAAAVQLEALHYLGQPTLPEKRCQEMQAALQARHKQLDAFTSAQGLTPKQVALYKEACFLVHQHLNKAQKIIEKYPDEPKFIGSFIKRARLRRIASHLLQAERQYAVVQHLNQPAQGTGVTGNNPDGKVQQIPPILKQFLNRATP